MASVCLVPVGSSTKIPGRVASCRHLLRSLHRSSEGPGARFSFKGPPHLLSCAEGCSGSSLLPAVGDGSESVARVSLPVLFADSWIENDSLSVDQHVGDQLDSGSIRSRGSVHSASSSEHKGLPMPRLQALPPGQVFNSSTGMQVLVIPSRDDHVLEVSVT